ncbi:hypothetical protein B0H67DRAFT_638717 [Lasiosphaeris hirsuta]|uniref:Oxidoreductase acuF-like C2H2 type zinc-finger domain-containing protein n=1 Tax=Lasiosphaeris hirsuta TaxID=260670 RepID=A0AA40B9R6_9PEZI|nr:hypothetical protein B0H67DRAFT_638717 [Lasiosphaeris hirsuta]
MANISLGTRPNRDTTLDPEHDFMDDDDDSAIDMGTGETAPDEAIMDLEVVSECIKSLFRVGIMVRKSAPRDRSKRALQIPEISFPSFYGIDYVKDYKTRLGADDDARDSTTNDGLEVIATATERFSSKATTSAGNNSLREPFECPICFTLQSFKHKKSWQTHAFGHLKAYVCMVGDTVCDDESFALGRFPPQSSKSTSRKHTGHSLLDAGHEAIASFKAGDLGPKHVVYVNASRFKKHVAAHREQLAIFALHRAVEEEGTKMGVCGCTSILKSLLGIITGE